MKKTELMQKMFKSLLTYFIFLLYIHTEGLCERLSKATISPWTLNCFCFSIMSEMKSVRKNMGDFRQFLLEDVRSVEHGVNTWRVRGIIVSGR